MSIEALGLWGCGRDGALDIWNNERTCAYIKNCGRTPSIKCCTPNVTRYLTPDDDPNKFVIQGGGGSGVDAVYSTPVKDNAWWYDPCRPESAGFFGLEVIRTTGLYANTRTQTVTSVPNAHCSTGLMYADPVDNGYEIVVEGILHGATCCAVRYGYLALKKVLRGCCGGTKCSGSALRYIPCIPTTEFDVAMCNDGGPCDLPDESGVVAPMRFVKNARIVDELEITRGAPDGMSCPNNCGCSPDTWVSFTIRAEAGQYTCERALIDSFIYGTDNCIADISICAATCDLADPLNDPLCPQPLIPPPPNAESSCTCPVFATDRRCLEFTLPNTLFDYQLEFKVETKSGPLRNFRVALWKKFGSLSMTSGVYDKCNQCSGFALAPLPAGTTWHTACGGVLVQTPGRAPVNANRTFLSDAGTPSDSCMRMSCGNYILCIYSDPGNTPKDARLQVSYRYVEP